MAGRRRPRRTTGPAAPTPGSAADRQPDADPVAVAKAIIGQQLSRAPRTRSQLAETLRRRGVPDAAAEQALDRFAELGYVDDCAFADAWVQSRHSGKGLSRRALEAELTRRGVTTETARAAAERVDPDTERATAADLVRRKLPGTRGLAPDARARRLVGMLARKGYSPGLAYAVVKQVLASDDQVLDDAGP